MAYPSLGLNQSPGTCARTIGRYLLFGEIAAGGMAVVHFGRLKGAAGFSRTVAIKRLHANLAREREFVAMFLDEARLAARIGHPNVVPTLDVVAIEGEIFLVMEYVHGESFSKLQRAMRRDEKPPPPRIIATIMSGVLHGLHAAHEAKSEQGELLNIVHRDVSPQNVIVGVDGVARVLDFGVAKAIGRLEATRNQKIKGKVAYMPPEQLEGGRVTRQTDIYAAAVVTWQALTGKRLFRGEYKALVKAILGQPVMPPSSLAPHVPEAFDDVVMRGLHRDPARRYATAREMALQLERCVGIASPSEVGDWVASLAQEELAKRAASLAEIESVRWSWDPEADLPREWMPTLVEGAAKRASRSSTPSEVSHVMPLTAAWPRRAMLAALVGGVALLGAALVAMVGLTRSLVTRTAPTAAIASATLAAPPAVSQVAEAPPRVTEWTATSAPSSKPAPHVAPPPRPARHDCDVPFTIDDKGHKHYKAACL